VEAFGWHVGATLMMSVLPLIPIVISLFIDTSRISGRGRRLSPGQPIFT
jgi:hypothetical protein